MMFGKREVFMTNQMDQYVKAKQALAQAGIDYDVKTFNAAAQGRMDRNIMTRMGSKPELEVFYYIYVKKAEEERARYAIREAFRKS